MIVPAAPKQGIMGDPHQIHEAGHGYIRGGSRGGRGGFSQQQSHYGGGGGGEGSHYGGNMQWHPKQPGQFPPSHPPPQPMPH